MSEWRGIETAPKDGTWLLLEAPSWNLPAIGAWTWLGGGSWQCMDSEIVGPTHWMLLPEPPEVPCG